MPELNREDIIKALECCIKTQCENCCNLGNWHEQWNCMTDLMKKALTLIKQLTEENERLKEIPEQLHKEMSERMIEERKIERKLIARKIFEEIEYILNHIGYLDHIDFEKLKKKYIGE